MSSTPVFTTASGNPITCDDGAAAQIQEAAIDLDFLSSWLELGENTSFFKLYSAPCRPLPRRSFSSSPPRPTPISFSPRMIPARVILLYCLREKEGHEVKLQCHLVMLEVRLEMLGCH
uniref:Uncharacterized protein n=1 Tax=Oryza nivara TaxID=4536 RepID=A0A0E0G4H0_ORYNI